jgi:hypothetical protein
MDDTPTHWNQGSFGAGVKIGNWNEDTYLREEELADFLMKHHNADLGFHKTDALLKISKEPSNVSTCVEGNVTYGSSFMLINPASKTALSSLPSIHVSAHETADDSMMCAAAPMGEADTHQPTRRNVFTVVPFDEQAGAESDPVKFGDKFFLQTGHPIDKQQRLYLYSEKPHINSAASRITKQQVVNLKPTNEGLNHYGAVWTLVLQDPEYRLEAEGSPVPANVEVLLKHVQSGQCLSCNHAAKAIISEFGSEFEVTANTNVKTGGGCKVEGSENHWVLAMKA